MLGHMKSIKMTGLTKSLADMSARPASLQQYASDSHDIELQNSSFG